MDGALAPAAAGTSNEIPFLHGVASGDPLPDSVILWTRVTPNRDALPGSTLGDDVRVAWEMATDEAFSTITRSGQAVASATSDHTVHIDPGGLSPDTVYFYRFRIVDGPHAGVQSPVGRTRTSPSPEANNSAVSFAAASCANWESGFFISYRDMANRARNGEIDYVVFLGDYIYEYPTGEYAGKSGVAREHHPLWETTTLEDYRIRYGRYRTDENLQAAHAAAPWIAVWDDHESANNSWREGAENHTDGEAEGTWPERRDASMQAYFEWLPIRAVSPVAGGHIYRSLRFGSLVELTMMDLRTYRDAETSSPNFADPDRTMLGSAQYQWVTDTVANSTARWNVLGNSVMFAPMRLLTLPNNPDANDAMTWISAQTTGIALNSDQWDGYAAERDKLLAALAQKNSNLLFLTGDIHSEWANSLAVDGQEVGAELVCTSISAPNVDEILTEYLGTYHPENNSTSVAVENALKGANPWVKHLEMDAHGYSIAAINNDSVEFRYVRVSNVEDPFATTFVAHTTTWSKGAGFSV